MVLQALSTGRTRPVTRRYLGLGSRRTIWPWAPGSGWCRARGAGKAPFSIAIVGAGLGWGPGWRVPRAGTAAQSQQEAVKQAAQGTAAAGPGRGLPLSQCVPRAQIHAGHARWSGSAAPGPEVDRQLSGPHRLPEAPGAGYLGARCADTGRRWSQGRG